MGDEETAEHAASALAPYRVDAALLDAAAPGAFALHGLPGAPRRGDHRRGPLRRAPRIWDQAENRRHAQKALLELLVASP